MTGLTPSQGGGRHDARVSGARVALYSQVIDRVIPVSSTQAAEMSKLLENIYRAVNIALVNELKMMDMISIIHIDSMASVISSSLKLK